MTMRKLNGPLGGDYVTDGRGNAVLVFDDPITDDNQLGARLTTAEETLATQGGRVTTVEKVTPLVRQPNYVAALGDSITIGNGANGVDVGSGSYLTWACAASGGVLVPLIDGFGGVAGNTTTQMLARITDIMTRMGRSI